MHESTGIHHTSIDCLLHPAPCQALQIWDGRARVWPQSSSGHAALWHLCCLGSAEKWPACPAKEGSREIFAMWIFAFHQHSHLAPWGIPMMLKKTHPPGRGKQTMACGPNLAHYLFLHSPLAKNGFYISKQLRKKTNEDYFVAHENYMKFKFKCSLTKTYWHTAHLFTHLLHLWLLSCYSGRVSNYGRDCWPTNLKYLLSGPL